MERATPLDLYEFLDSRPTTITQSITEFLRAHGSTKQFLAGDIVVREGDACDAVYIILEGVASILKADPIGGNITIASAEIGAVFGEMGVFLNLRRSATIVAKTPLVVLLLSNEKFLTALNSYPEMTLRLLKALSGRLNQLNERFTNLLNNKTMIMIGCHILEIAERRASEKDEILVSLKDLTRKSGLDTRQVSGCLANYQRLNIISNWSPTGDDLVSFQINQKILKSYINSISLARIE